MQVIRDVSTSLPDRPNGGKAAFCIMNELERYEWKVSTNKSSTFLRAQGILRKNLRLDLMVGLLLKQSILIKLPNFSHP